MRPATGKDDTQPSLQRPCHHRVPAGFVSLRTVPGIRLDIRYHTRNNFMRRPLPGYGAPGAWLIAPAARALAKVQRDLAPRGLGLWIFDAYRPRRATQAMVSWARKANPALIGPYIGARSLHNNGIAVDLTLYRRATGKPLDMGSAFDAFSTRSHTRNATGAALQNRLRLKQAMARRGFKPYAAEWWHFHYPTAARPRDVPYGCAER
ncbi:MAG: M15 family metallopeptidase [bacterium]